MAPPWSCGFRGMDARLALGAPVLQELWALGGQAPQAWQEVTPRYFRMSATGSARDQGSVASINCSIWPCLSFPCCKVGTSLPLRFS